ncbi:GntR family transcriptional regulator [Marinobacterium rhizophilum]|uniref:GntR family transcriptional regulator n=1 Tax=Marinobacterium rhizophilum TaxID=420402 RepID=UPI001F0B5544|nr:GntR family transcriptional regulator [Marinobacterium rhizophilum]
MQEILGKEGLSKVAYDAVMRMILARELSAGEVLQERRLAEALDMSRTPVREALRQLEAESWLVRLSARTIAVKRVSLDEYISALQVRELIEPEAAAIAAVKAEPGMIRNCRQQLQELMEATKPSPNQQWEFDQALHLGIANATHNKVLAKIVTELRKTTQLFENQTLPARTSPGHDEHLAIIDAIEQRDPEAARLAMQVHLRQTKRNILDAL